MNDDDLTPYADAPVVTALRAPAREEELAGEDAALAMFRRTVPPLARRRALRRTGVGGAGVLLGLALTGGVAAAYGTTALPDAVQNAVHAAIAPLGLPAPPAAARPAPKVTTGVHPSVVGPRVIGSPQPPSATSPSAGPAPAAHPAPPAASPGAAPAPTSPPTPAPAQPPTWSVAVSPSIVPVHSDVVLSGRLTRSGTAVAGRRAYAAELSASSSQWQRVATGRTGSDGRISLTVPALDTNVRLRLVTEGGVASRQLAVTVVPKLSVSTARAQGSRVATVAADGGRAGDSLVLLRRDGDAWTHVATTALNAQAQGQFTVPAPGPTRVRYRVRLPATRQHGSAFVEFVVPAR